MGGALRPRFVAEVITDWLVKSDPNAAAIEGYHQTKSNGTQPLASTGRSKKKHRFHGPGKYDR
jgi:hypothetical protein